MLKRRLGAVVAIVALAFPAVAAAYPFGGMIGQIIFCYNNAIYTAVGPPRGGPFIWTPSTRTYQFGPPTHVGQWLLGLAAPPYYCLVSVEPIIVWSGILMTMEGSSGPAAPGLPGGGLGNSSANSNNTSSGGNSGGTTQPRIGHVVVSEVYYQADAQHGGKTEHQWLELFNGSGTDLDISRWTIRTANTSQAIPSGTTIPANSYVVLAGSADVRTLWTIPQTVQVIPFPNAFAGFVAQGDHVFLQDSAGARVDAMSWGSDTQGFNPSAPTIQISHALIRKTLVSDADAASDWVDTAAPTPGR